MRVHRGGAPWVSLPLVGLVLGVFVLTGCATSHDGPGQGLVGRGLQPADGATRDAGFATGQPVWALDRTIQVGPDQITAPGPISALWRTDYGLIVSTRQRSDPARTGSWFLTGNERLRLPGAPRGIKVSPDGRYAGWIDFSGPATPIADVVVVDLSTGREVLRNHDQMGDTDMDDLADQYDEPSVFFLGFDDEYAYWDALTGPHEVRRARIGDWRPEDGGRDSTQGLEVVDGEPYDAMIGHVGGMDEDGTLSDTSAGASGFRSPGGRWCFTFGEPVGSLGVVDCRTAADVTPRYPGQDVEFAGWLDDTDFLVLTFQGPHRYGHPPDAVGTLARCALPTVGTCTEVLRSHRARHMIFPGASAISL